MPCRTLAETSHTRFPPLSDQQARQLSRGSTHAAQMIYFQWTLAMPSLRVLLLPEEYCARCPLHTSPSPCFLLAPLNYFFSVSQNSRLRSQIARLRLLARRPAKSRLGTRAPDWGGRGDMSAGARMRTGRARMPPDGAAEITVMPQRNLSCGMCRWTAS